MPQIQLLMDGLLLVFLGGTMFFAWRLSRSLGIFRKSRADLDRLVQDLARNIDRAERAIAGMKATAKDSGKVLESLIEQGKTLSDELQMMTESGDNLASRLEHLAARGNAAPAGPPAREMPPRRSPERAMPGFAIRDRDFDEDPSGAETPDDADGLTRAERELMTALKGGKKGMQKGRGT